MDQNSELSMQEAMRLAQSPAGQQLFALLQQKNGADLQKAISSASAGDYQSAKTILSSLLDSPEAKALLQQFGR